MKDKQLFWLLVISLVLCQAAGQINVPLYSDNHNYFLNMAYGTDKSPFFSILTYYGQTECGQRQENDYNNFHYYRNQLSFTGVEFTFNITCFINYNQLPSYSRISLPNTLPNYPIGLIDSLYSQGTIKTKRYFYNVEPIEDSQLYGEMIYQIGSFQIGEPDLSLLEKGTQLTTMKNKIDPQDFFGNFSIHTNNKFRYEGQSYKMEENEFRIEPDLGNSWPINKKLFTTLVTLWVEKGLDFTQQKESSYLRVYFPSIEQLSPIDFILFQEDGSEFVLSIDPKYYTTYNQDTKMYRLNFYPQSYSTSMVSVGKRILEKYYYGFDLSTSKTILGKKKSVQNSQMKQLQNFRGSVML